MNQDDLLKLLEEVKNGRLETKEALQMLKDFTIKDLGFAQLDTHRALRTGYPEVIFGQGKTPDQIREIFRYMYTRNNNILATRVTEEMYQAILEICPEAVYNVQARTITVKKVEMKSPDTFISVIAAGTSDLPVVEEAAVTAEIFGNNVERIIDVGVAGIHRLYDKIARIREARVNIVVAGMEGALPSIVGGLVDKPVIAVPTSVGYGANFGGLSALLGMLTSCASGVCVVNIDNGFGAGFLASMINKL
ncbi:MAG: nickel pincer cofactor biosynthesis protein LarB [Bacteroidales bacterium]|nr:nickel pincer cofactor biosynthesis protein LarB [Bacteroidales bacterium]